MDAVPYLREREMGRRLTHPFPFDLGDGPDYRGIPTIECVCGSNLYMALVAFDDDRNVAWYALDGVCVGCGALLTLPTPIDEGVCDGFA